MNYSVFGPSQSRSWNALNVFFHVIETVVPVRYLPLPKGVEIAWSLKEQPFEYERASAGFAFPVQGDKGRF